MIMPYFSLFVCLVCIINVIHFLLKFKNKYTLYNFIDNTINVASLSILIYHGIFFLKQYIKMYEHFNIYALITMIVLIILYLALDFYKSKDPKINLIAKDLLAFMYGITFIATRCFILDIYPYYYIGYLTLITIFNLLAYLIVFSSNLLIKYIDTKDKQIQKQNFELNEKIYELNQLNQQYKRASDELRIKNQFIKKNEILLYKLRDQIFDLTQAKDDGNNEVMLQCLIDNALILIQYETSLLSGYQLMDEVLKQYQDAIKAKKIKLTVDFRNIYLNMPEQNQKDFFKLILDYVISVSNDEAVKISSTIDQQSSYFTITFSSQHEFYMDDYFKQLFMIHDFYCLETKKQGVMYVILYQ